MTVATTDGRSVWSFRYSSEHDSRSLYFSTDVIALRRIHPELEILSRLGDETRLIVSEPLRDLEGAWHEVPESSAGVIRPGRDEVRPFHPVAPS
jgi:glutamine amidotransferase